MRTIFSTRILPARDRFDYWHSVACSTILAHDSEPRSRHDFHAELSMGALYDLGLFSLQTASMSVTYKNRHIALAASDDFLVCRQIAGRLALEQQGRAYVLEAGDFAILDPQLPYVGTYRTDSELLLLRVPRKALAARLGDTRRFLGTAMKPSRAENAMTSSIMALLPEHADGLASVAEVMRDHVLDLIALSFGRSVVPSHGPAATARALVLTKIRAVIDSRVADPGLNPAIVAAAAGVDLREADDILDEAGTSVRQLIMEQRLMKCSRMLQDPLQSHRSAADIASACGLRDSATFRRKFTAVFGRPPDQFRRGTGSDCAAL